MMGFAWGMAGLSVPVTGMVADRIGIERTLMMMAFLPVAAAVLAWPLPGGKGPHTPARGSETVVSEVTGTEVAE
jgi:nitrate/nitrite transporter NarK